MGDVLRVLAVADTHVSESMALAGCRPTTPSGEPLVIAQHRAFWAWLEALAVDRGVDLVCHGGDVYETPRPTPLAESTLFRGVRDIVRNGIGFLAIPGNHDVPVGGGTHALEPLKSLDDERAHVFDWPKPMLVDRAGRTLQYVHDPSWLAPDQVAMRTAAAVVFPLPYPSRSYLQSVALSPEHANGLISDALQQVLDHYVRLAAHVPAGVAKVMLFHGTMRGAAYRIYQLAPATDIQVDVATAWPSFDIHVAGHVHRRQTAPGTLGLPGYVGSPDRHDFGEEDEPKGVSLFEFDPATGSTSCTFIAYPYARVFRTLRIGGDFDEADGAVDLYPCDDGLTDEAPDTSGVLGLADQTVYRLKGVVTPLGHQRAGRLVRSLRARGYIIGNATEVQHGERARVEVRAGASEAEAIEAVFQARPDLAARRDRILPRIEAVRRELAAGEVAG